jgi:hypothetical protein
MNWALNHVDVGAFLASGKPKVWLKGPVREKGESEMLWSRF